MLCGGTTRRPGTIFHRALPKEAFNETAAAETNFKLLIDRLRATAPSVLLSSAQRGTWRTCCAVAGIAPRRRRIGE
jgi:hypothetical protein